MSTKKTAKYCHFCSEFSQANGEDPIGSAGNHECWLIIETAPPWKINIWLEPNPMPQEVLDVLKLSWERGIKIAKAIAPDRKFSYPGYKHVFYFSRPPGLFSRFEKHEFLVPENEVGSKRDRSTRPLRGTPPFRAVSTA